MLVKGCYNTIHTNALEKTQTLACQKPAPGTWAATCDPAPADSTKPLTHAEASVANFQDTHHSQLSVWGWDPHPLQGWYRDLTGSSSWCHRSSKGGHSPRLTAAADPLANINIPESSIIHVHIHLTHSLDKKWNMEAYDIWKVSQHFKYLPIYFFHSIS